MKSRRWHHGVAASIVALSGLALATGARAECPPASGDGVVVTQPPWQLAWRPLLPDGSVIPPERIPMAGHFVIEVQLCKGAQSAAEALTRVDATMPEHRHGMNYRPRISPLGDGRFRVDGMMFHMSGRWQLEFEIGSGATARRLLHDIQIR